MSEKEEKELVKYGSRWLNKMRREEQEIEITFLDGEALRGKISEVGKYEFDFECNGVTLMIYKHAIKYIQYEK